MAAHRLALVPAEALTGDGKHAKHCADPNKIAEARYRDWLEQRNKRLTEYSNPRMEAVIDGWPIGRTRTTATFKIESVPGRGQRGTRFTIDPKTGKPSATKKLTYARKARIVDGDDGKTYIIELSMYGHVSVMQGGMQFIAESVPGDDPRMPALLALFA